MYRTSPEAANYLNIRLSGEAFESALLAAAKEELRDCFYTKRGKAKLDLPHAKAMIDDFEKAGPGLASMVDLRLCYQVRGIKKEFRELYSSAKTRKQILTSLDPC